MKIESRENQKIKYLKKLRDKKKERYESKSFFVEGERIIENIDPSLILEVYIDEDYNGYIPDISKDKIYVLNHQVFDDIKDTVTTQGIIAIVKMLDRDMSYDDNSPIIILDDVKDPGNVGTILRTSEAAGVKEIIFIGESCDPYSPKAIRSSMSSITRLNIKIASNFVSIINTLKNKEYKIYATSLDVSTSIYEENYHDKVCIVFGNEANGVREEVIRLCDKNLHIPMDGKIESLNVATSVAIVLYELKRKRHHVS